MKELIISLLLSSGTFSGSFQWTVNDLGLDVLQGKIGFQTQQCSKYELIQSAQVQDNQQQVLVWSSGEKPRNLMHSKHNYFIDHQASKCHKGQSCSPIYRTFWPQEGQMGTKNQPAQMADYPYGWSEFSQIKLETCAQCQTDGKILGCIKWGGKFPTVGNKEIFQPQVSREPSEDFQEALTKFNNYYGNISKSTFTYHGAN